MLCCLTITTVAQNHPNFDKWLEMAEEDISLQPEYGRVEKTPQQKEFDSAFLKDIIQDIPDTLAASDKMAELGFQYLYERGDFITAMRRFNQAYLLNPENPDIYHGFGTIYFNLGASQEAREQYDKGLKMDPQHQEMLTDYGTTYLGDYYASFDTNRESAEASLDEALEYFLKADEVDDSNPDTNYKLSIVYLYQDNCSESKKYLRRAKRLNNSNITEEYEAQVKASCE